MKKFNKKTLIVTVGMLVAPAVIYALDTTVDNITALYTGKFGSSNTVSATPAASIGWNNLNNNGGTLTVGEGLYVPDKNCTVLGQYNKYDSPQGSELLLVGNGISTSLSNAFEVMTSGNVNVPLNLPVGAGTNPKLTVGSTTLSGSSTVTAKIYGTAEIDRVPAKGGISMGSYTAP